MVALLVGLLAATAVGAGAHGDNRDHAALVDEVLEHSGIKNVFTLQFSREAPLSPEQRAGLTPRDEAALKDIMRRAFQPDRMLGLVRRTFLTRFDHERMAELATWLRSPLARKMTDLEVKASDPGLDLTSFTVWTRGLPPPASRRRLIERIDQAASLTDGSFDLVAGILRSAFRALEPGAPPGRIEEVIARVQEQQYGAVKEMIAVRMLYTYQSVSDEELGEYVSFYESPTGKWYAATVLESVSRAGSEAMTRAGEELGKYLRRRKTTS